MRSCKVCRVKRTKQVRKSPTKMHWSLEVEELQLWNFLHMFLDIFEIGNYYFLWVKCFFKLITAHLAVANAARLAFQLVLHYSFYGHSQAGVGARCRMQLNFNVTWKSNKNKVYASREPKELRTESFSRPNKRHWLYSLTAAPVCNVKF